MTVIAPSAYSVEEGEWAFAEPEPQSPPRRALTWRQIASRQIMAGLAVLFIALVHVVNINNWPLFFDDEGTYVAEAWAVYTRGDLAHYTYWYDHPPGGWLQLAAFFVPLNLLGIESSVLVGRYVMVLYTAVTSGLIFKLGRNLGLRVPAALAGMLLWGLCPLVIFEARQVMLDNMATAWLMGALICATSRRQYLSRHLLAGVCFAMAILTKETTVVLAPALLFAMWTHAYKATRWFSVMASVMMTVLVVAIYPLYAVLKSELVSGQGHVSLQDAIAFQLMDRTGSGSVWDTTSVAYETVKSWLFYDQFLLVAGLAAGLVCLALRNVRVIGLCLLIFSVVALRPGGYLPLMYVIAVLPFAALAVVGVGQWLFDQIARVRINGAQVGRGLALVAAVVAAVALGSQWAAKNAYALTDRPNDPYYSALHHVVEHVDRSSTILVDDSYWNPLVDAGWSSDGWRGAIWYFKLDLDPVARESDLPNGWKDIDYILVNDVMVRNFDGLSKLPQVSDAYKHSQVIEQWGTGQDQVQLRKINEDMVAYGSVAEAARAKPGVPPVLEPEAGTEPEATVRKKSSFSNGQWTVGKDITPGTYAATSRSSKCYWAKISDVQKGSRSKSQYGKEGRLIVKITSRDDAFLTTACGTWTRINQ
jgi:hypothetical protein